MKSSWALAAAVFAHAMLIGLLMGMSNSPVVGVVLPLLMGVGGYKVIDVLMGNPPSSDAKAPSRQSSARVGWMVALWCVAAIASLFTGIALRNGFIHLGRPPETTLALVRLDHQPVARIPELALICSYYDRLDLSPTQRRAVASALSDPALETSPLLSNLQTFFSQDHGPSAARAPGPAVYEFSPGGRP